MKRIERVLDIGFMVEFVVLGVIALVAVCMGAWWHWWTVGMSVTMVLLMRGEAKREQRTLQEGSKKGEAA